MIYGANVLRIIYVTHYGTDDIFTVVVVLSLCDK